MQLALIDAGFLSRRPSSLVTKLWTMPGLAYAVIELLYLGKGYLLWWVTFRIVLGGSPCKVVEITSWIPLFFRGFLMPISSCSRWWCFVGVWEEYSWHFMGPLMHPNTALTGDMYLEILFDHLHYLCSKFIYSARLGRF